jgi:hypothetical protein
MRGNGGCSVIKFGVKQAHGKCKDEGESGLEGASRRGYIVVP